MAATHHGTPGARRRAVVVDESPLLRHGVGAVLDRCGLVVALDTGSAADGLAILRTSGIDLLVAGVPADGDTATLVERARAASPTARMVVLVPRQEPDDLRRLLATGPEAVLTRTASVDDVVDAVERVTAGERVVAPAHLSTLLGSLAAADAVANPLTHREMVVLTHLSNGRSNRDIAEAMVVSVATVKTHLSHIYEKLGVSGRQEAVGKGIELRILT